MNRPVVIFGATSFVGGALIERLLAAGRPVIAVTRRTALAELVLQQSPLLSVVDSDAAQRAVSGGDFDVVNLAYVKDAPTSQMYEANRALVAGVGAIVRLGCRRLVHISTAAVFGYRFAGPPQATRVRWRPLGPYSESKIHAEQLIERVADETGADTVILRLGNVVGVGSPTWTGTVAQRILAGRPVSYIGESGYLNATDVVNTAGYIDYLLGDGDVTSGSPGRFQHLAEFSAPRWPELLDVFSAAVGREWRAVARRGEEARGLARAKSAVKQAYDGPVGSYARLFMDRLPRIDALENAMDAVKANSIAPGRSAVPVAGPEDEELLEIMCSEYEFRSATCAGWQPAIDFSESCRRMAEWIELAGYRIPNGRQLTNLRTLTGSSG